MRDRKYLIAILAILALISPLVSYLPTSTIFLTVICLFVLLILANLIFIKIPIFPYDTILSAVSTDGGVVWDKENGIRLGAGSDRQVYYPKVVPIESGWRMYFRAGSYRAFIASAVSENGLDWSVEHGKRIAVDDCGKRFSRVEGCDVMRLSDGTWLMYFSAQEDQTWRIYRSLSLDGLMWEKSEVCIDTTNEETLTDVKAPSVVFFNGLFRMFFTRFSSTKQRIFSSISEDGISWKEHCECLWISEPGVQVYNPHVIRTVDSGLRLYFTERAYAFDPTGADIRSAVSPDGIHWKKEEGVRIGPGKGYDKHGIFNVDIVPLEKGYRMYYTGYWGRHLLEPLTLRYYRKRRERAYEQA